MNYLYIFVGGLFGSILRYILGELIHPLSSGFPIQTFLINIVGCFFLGFFLPLAHVHIKEEYTLLIGTGFAGAFTTFASFSLDNVKLIDENKIMISIIYIMASIVIGGGLSFIGYKVAKKFNKIKGESTL